MLHTAGGFSSIIMANIAVQRIRREFKEVVKSDEVNTISRSVLRGSPTEGVEDLQHLEAGKKWNKVFEVNLRQDRPERQEWGSCLIPSSHT